MCQITCSLLVLTLVLSTCILILHINMTNMVQIGIKEILLSKPKIQMEDDSIVIPMKAILRSPVVLEQDSLYLITYIRKYYIIEGSKDPYNLKKFYSDPSMGQSTHIKEILRSKRDGFFVECGALDGETRSNTLMFEKDFNWDGILIEGDPKNANLIRRKNRRAYIVPVCLSALPYPKKVMFRQQFNLGKIVDTDVGSRRKNSVEVQCIPFYSIMLALGIVKIDYFSLDVEGNELEVLQTIPWDKINITTLSVEYIHTAGGKRAIQEFMEQLGYIVYATVTNPQGLANDLIFYHPKLLGRRL